MKTHPDQDGGENRFVFRRLWVKRLFTYGVGWPLILYCLLALFMPTDIFDKVPALETLANRVADAVSGISRNLILANHAQATSFPQPAFLCSAIALILIPWLILAASTGFLLGYAYGRVESRTLKLTGYPQLLFVVFIVCLGTPLGLWVINIFYGIPGDPSVYAGVTTISRLGYALISTGVVILSAGCIWLQPIYIVVLVDKLIFGGFKNV